MRVNKRIIMWVVLAAGAFFCTASEGAQEKVNLEDYALPLISGAQDLWGGVQNLEINGTSSKALFYSTTSTAQDTLDFYRREVSGRGWKAGEEYKEINIISFINGKDYLYVATTPRCQTPEGVPMEGVGTNFLLILCKEQIRLCVPMGNKKELDMDIPDVGGSDLAFVPRPPNSKRALGIIRQDKEAFFIYFTKEDASKIVDFYRKELPQAGWRLGQKLSVPRTCIDAMFSATALSYERKGGRDKLTILLNYFADGRQNMIFISYNFSMGANFFLGV